MNLSNEELEKELSNLKPQSPGRSLENSIQARIEASSGNRTTIPLLWPVLACAACLAFVAFVLVSRHETGGTLAPSVGDHTENLSGFETVGAEQRLVEAIDDGVILTTENEPVRRLRYQFIDSITLVNHNDGSLFTMEVPREEILFVPITLL